MRSQSVSNSRLVSLDVLRGLTVAVMILVNNAGDGSVSYAQLRHSVWNGCTLTDVVFPMFLFIMGISMALSFDIRLKRGAAKGAILLQVARRALLIFAIGLFLNLLPSFQLATLRYYGVLQRIAICYLIAAIIFLAWSWWGSLAATVVALAGYWWLLMYLPVPGFGRPGVNVGILDPIGNLPAYVDRLLVPSAHLYHQGTYDPEGLLSTIPAVATTLFGVLTAAWLKMSTPPARKAAVLAGCGVALILLGLVWRQAFPLNKRLWTSSYVLLTSGISIALFAILYWLIDAIQWLRRGLVPWLAFGMNALTAYVLSELLAIVLAAIPLHGYGNLQYFLFQLLPGWLGSPAFVSMLYSVLFVGVCFLPIFWLYKRRILIKL